uniref:Uncharacterized protein n=1 Tax=Vitis vinifera TaxID=29760 RepID=F6H8Y8_VITVI
MTTNCSIIKVQDSSNRLEIELTMSGQQELIPFLGIQWNP